jgi:hypothetical protein
MRARQNAEADIRLSAATTNLSLLQQIESVEATHSGTAGRPPLTGGFVFGATLEQAASCTLASQSVF